MPSRGIHLMIAAAAAALYSAPAASEPREIQGIVVTNENGQLTIKTPAGNQTFSLSADARIRSISGPLGGQKEEVPAASLLPGLPVTIEGDDASGSFVISEVDYKAKDYKTAAQIQAGVEETARRSEEVRSAYSKMGQWDIRAEENIYFKSGSTVVWGGVNQNLINLAV
jgi:OOP family OmpA-OmpF porin